jgi:hypothetical protein
MTRKCEAWHGYISAALSLTLERLRWTGEHEHGDKGRYQAPVSDGQWQGMRAHSTTAAVQLCDPSPPPNAEVHSCTAVHTRLQDAQAGCGTIIQYD